MPAHQGEVPFQKIAPAAVAQPRGDFRGLHDVYEEHAREDPVGFTAAAHASRKFLDFIKDLVCLSGYLIGDMHASAFRVPGLRGHVYEHSTGSVDLFRRI